MKARKKNSRAAWLGGLLACLGLLLGTGCQDITGITPTVFLPPLAWCTPVPGNCTFALAGDLTASINGAPVTGDTTSAPNNFNLDDNFGWSGPDHVYSFTLCNTRRLTIATCGTLWDTVVILTGDPCVGEVLNNPGLPEEDDGCGTFSGPSRFSTVLPPGVYHIIVDGYAGASGEYTLSVTTP